MNLLSHKMEQQVYGLYEKCFRILFGMQSGPIPFLSLSLLSVRKTSCTSIIKSLGRGPHDRRISPNFIVSSTVIVYNVKKIMISSGNIIKS